MILRHSLLIIEQNKYNALVRLSNTLWNSRKQNPNYAKEHAEVNAKMQDAYTRIKELS
jgi:hypothetical protein